MQLDQVRVGPGPIGTAGEVSQHRLDEALTAVRDALEGDTGRFGLAPPHCLAVSLRELESALHERAADCWLEDDAAGDAGALRRLRTELCELACRAEVLSAAAATGSDLPRTAEGARRLLVDVRSALSREADALLDAWWVDLGVGD